MLTRDSIQEYDIFGLRIHSASISAVLQFVDRYVKLGPPKVIYGYSLTLIARLKEYPEIATLGNSFDLVLPEGKGMYWLARWIAKEEFEEHFNLPDLVEALLVHANKSNYSIMLLGATEETNRKAQENIRTKYASIPVVHGINGYFEDTEEEMVLERIGNYSPDIILIGISSPQKERLAKKLSNQLKNGIIVPCGGMIDVLAGLAKREPALVKRSGLTWLYRFMQEPRRLMRPILWNGLYVLFFLLPIIVWKRSIKGEKEFSLLAYFKNR